MRAKRSESKAGKSAQDSISAFSNEPGLGGGDLIFGFAEQPDRTFVAKGLKNPKKIESELSTVCAAAFNRTIRPRVWTEMMSGVALVAAFIPEVDPSEGRFLLTLVACRTGRIGALEVQTNDVQKMT